MTRAATKYMEDQPDLSGLAKLFLALSDGTRLRLLALMAGGPASVGYLAEKLQQSQPKISRHLAYLRNTGLVSTTREGKWVYYQIETQPDPAVQNVLEAALRSMTAPNASQKSGDPGRTEYISPQTYMSSWEPNEIDVFLL
jgi:DNA-binding transcriptional ArsR family regulator